MRALILLPLLALAGCSGENQGWNPNYRAEATPYGDYLRAREMALTGRAAEPPRVIPMARPFKAPTPAEIAGPSPVQILERDTTRTVHAAGIRPARTLGALDRSGAPAVDAHGARPTAVTAPSTGVVVAAPVATRQVTAPSPALTAPGAPVVVTATALPPAGADPLAAYATASRHAPGTARFARSGGSGGDCARFATPAEAQRAFLSAGGPDRDPLGLDRDGDGYVCGWTPGSHRGGAL